MNQSLDTKVDAKVDEKKREDICVNVYVVHYTKLEHRKQTIDNLKKTFKNISSRFPHIKTTVNVVVTFDPEGLHPDFVKRIFEKDDLVEPENVFFNKLKLRSPNINIISNCLKHMDAIRIISSIGTENDINIVVEDDVYYNENFETQFEQFVNRKEYKKYDMIFFGLPGDKPSNYSDGDGVVIIDNNMKTATGENTILPCCDSFYISNTAAKKMSAMYFPIRFPHNIQMSYLIDKLHITTGKTYPNLLVDGSKVGFATSTITPNNILLFNNAYKMIYRLLSKPQLDPEDIQVIDKVLMENNIQNNPDFMLLEGLYHMKRKNFEKSQECFDNAYDGFEKNMSPLNNQSVLVQNYIELSRHIQ
jgi:hypothetical protein